jgi:hypothetical protein
MLSNTVKYLKTLILPVKKDAFTHSHAPVSGSRQQFRSPGNLCFVSYPCSASKFCTFGSVSQTDICNMTSYYTRVEGDHHFWTSIWKAEDLLKF